MVKPEAINAAYNLLKELNIHRVFQFKDHLEIRKEFENQAIIAMGGTEEEVLENFYQLYNELFNPA